MIQGTKNWLRRNRANFAIGAGVLGAGYMAGQYALAKFNESRQRMADERIAKENLGRRFEQNQEDCTFTVLAILPTATDNIMAALPIEDVLEELQRQKATRLARSIGPSEIASSVAETVDEDRSTNSFVMASQVTLDERGIPLDPKPTPTPSTSTATATTAPMATPVTSTSTTTPADKPRRSKIQLWDDMKIGALTRAFTLVYTLSLLTLLTRIQLNLLGRRNYLASVVSLAAPAPSSSGINLENHDDDADMDGTYGNDFETNRRYLSLSWWLLHRSCIDLMDQVRSAVVTTFGPVSPRADMTLPHLATLTARVRAQIESPDRKWLTTLLPPPEMESHILRESGMSDLPASSATTHALRRLLDETSDVIDSPAFTTVLSHSLSAAFSVLDSKISTAAFKIPPSSTDAARAEELTGPLGGGEGPKAKVAACVAAYARQAQGIGSGVGNEYLNAIEGVGELKAFAAVVYSSNFEAERPGSGGAIVVEKEEVEGVDEGFEKAWGRAGTEVGV